MIGRRFLLAGLVFLAGYGGLALLFPRLDPAVRWGARYDRAQLVTRAREVAARHGVDASGWNAVAVTRRDRSANRYLEAYPLDGSPASKLAFIATDVVLHQGAHVFRIKFAGDGRLLGVRERGAEGSAGAQGTLDADRALALAAMKELAGGEDAAFVELPATDQGKEGRRFRWEQAQSDAGSLKYAIEATVLGGRVTESQFKPVYPPDVAADPQNTWGETVLAALAFLTLAGGVLAALLFFFFGIARKVISYRTFLAFTLAALAVLAIRVYLGDTWDLQMTETLDPTIKVNVPGNLSARTLLLISFFVSQLLAALLVLLFEGGRQGLRVRRAEPRANEFGALWQGKWFARPVASHLAIGLCWGGLIAALPYVISLSGIAGRVRVEHESSQRLLATSTPGLLSLLPGGALSPTFLMFIIFGFLMPLLGSVPRFRLPGRLVGFIAGAAILSETGLFLGTHVPAVVLVAALTMLIGDHLQRRYDLLAVFAAGYASEVIRPILALLSQPGPALHRAGLLSLLALGLGLAVALVLSWKGAELGVEEQDSLARAAAGPVEQVERERLKAEFDVAHRAQQQMLPDSVPYLPGFDIAGLCRPSKEVGGDLFDYIPMSEDRLGIVVADVSGKGVPASLYMTLTKGLVRSAAQGRTDPGEILREVNKHLYEVCRRKMFVTLFLGILDPHTRTMTYSRAGHNPPVWRNVKTGATSLLRPPGPGLGLTSSRSFDRALKVEQIQLDPDDALFIYSDGITEAMNPATEEYGEERLIALAERADGLGAQEALDAVLADVGAFLDGHPPQDDQTLVVIRVADL